MTNEQFEAACVKQLEVALRPLVAGYPLDQTEVRAIILALQNDVRRLRGLVATAERRDYVCSWCDADRGLTGPETHHRDDCPAFSAPGVVR